MKGRRRISRVVLSRVTKRFGSTVALRGIDADVGAGEVTLIVGANGSGKSTMLGVLGTIIKPSSGRVRYALGAGAADEDHPGALIRGEIGWVSHEVLAYGDLSGRANIELAASMQGIDVRRSWAALEERFELGQFVNRPLRTNSRGQRQRVALARALVHQPSLVLLDEPTTGLDKSGIERLLGVVRECLDDQCVVVVVAHDPETFDRFAPRVVRLDRGRIEG